MRLAVLLALFVCGCAAAPVRPGPEAAAPAVDSDAVLRAEVAAVRESARAALREQAELYWKIWSSGEAPASASAPGEAGQALFSAESFGRIEALRQRTEQPEEAGALRSLGLFVAGGYAARQSEEAASAAASALASATVRDDGREMPFRDVELLLSREAHAGRRRELAKATVPVLQRVNALVLESDRQREAALVALGFAGAQDYALALRRVDPAALALYAEEVLVQSEAAYLAAMARLTRGELRLGLAGVRRADLARLFRTGRVDSYFPKDGLASTLVATLESLGLGALPGLHLDTESRPAKSPRALAIPVDPPGDVRLSIKPADGVPAWSQAFHEVGHAVGFAAVTAPGFEQRNLGTSLGAEVIAELFEALLAQPRFLVTKVGVPEARAEEHAQRAALRRLLELRRVAGKLLFELGVDPRPEEAPADRYRRIMSRALGFPVEDEGGERYLIEREALLGEADRLRAAALSVLVEGWLASTVGAEWWSDPRSGAALARLAEGGTDVTVEDVLRILGAPALEASAVIEPLKSRLDAP